MICRPWSDRWPDLDGSRDLASVAATYRDWAVSAALPFWAADGWNAATGLFHERMLISGEPDQGCPLRTRVQARQIYVYAHAAMLGWWHDRNALALSVFDRLCETAAQPGRPGFCHLMTSEAVPLDERRDTYDHAFLVLAFSWLWRATGEARVKTQLERLLAEIDTLFAMPDGSVREDGQDTLPRRQNPHMHLFEAMLACHATDAMPDGLARADRLLSVIRAHFFDESKGLIGEFFDEHLWLLPGMKAT